MGNPIQYRNTDNPPQIQGWVSHNKGGFRKTAFIVLIRPSGAYPGGVNENVSPAILQGHLMLLDNENRLHASVNVFMWSITLLKLEKPKTVSVDGGRNSEFR